MEIYKKEEDKLVEEIPQPPIKNSYTRAEVEKLRDDAVARRDIKQAELDGANQEVSRFDAMLAKCDELGVVADEQNV